MAQPQLVGSQWPEVQPSREPPEVAVIDGLIRGAPSQPWDGLHTVEPGEKQFENDVVIREKAAPKALLGWPRRRLWVVIVAVLVLIAVVVGATVGALNRGSKSSSKDKPESPSETPTTKTTGEAPSETAFGTPMSFSEDLKASDSACHGTICPPVLASARYSPQASSIFVFALGSDGGYWYRKAEEDAWANSWTPLGGSFRSQPSTMNISPGRIEVFGVWNEDLSIRSKTYRQDGGWDVDWVDMGGKHYSVPGTCEGGIGSPQVFSVSSGQRMSWREHEDGKWVPNWWKQANTGYVASSLAGACSNHALSHVAAYGESKSPHPLMVKRHNGTVWTYWEPLGGDFRGDPAVARVGSSRTAFFGIGSNGEMSYTSWSDDEELGNKTFVNLGGEFVSVPAILATGDGRIDVFAVGGDGRLKHNALVEDAWRSEWEDLGGFFSSAPTVMRTGDEDAVVVFGLGPDGGMMHGKWKPGTGHSWGAGRWYMDGGELSDKWFRAGPA